MERIKIVFLDVTSIGEDIDLSGFERLGQVERYPLCSIEESRERLMDADVAIINKTPMDQRTLRDAKKLKLVCVTATGTDNLDKDYLNSRGIAWRNVAGYSTESVAQHTFAMLFYLLEKLPYYDNYVKSGAYVNDTCFTHFANVFHEIHGMTWGIVGMGAIGRRVAELARLFGCRVIYYSTSGKNQQEGYERVDFDGVLAQSDILSVHAPLNADTRRLMNAAAFSRMKKSAIFLNVGRGPIVDEADLAHALRSEQIAAAGLDVLCQEPMAPESPLREIQDSGRLLITPHIAWASVEARTRLMKIIEGQVEEFLKKTDHLGAC